jgi:hypothetical protein
MGPLDNWSASMDLQLLAELVSAIAGVLSLLVSIYFGLKSRPTPELREISEYHQQQLPDALESSALAARSALAWAICGLLVHYVGWPVLLGFVPATLLGTTAEQWLSLLESIRAFRAIPRRRE